MIHRFALLIAGALTAVTATAHAEQFVLFDAMFTYTKMQADTSSPSKSHYYVKGTMLNQMRPTNWLAPIDYRNGTVHIRTEVIDKPAGGEITQWILCYIANQGGYGCAGTGTYREKGLYERDTSMTSWWNNTTIMWQAGIKQMDLVMKDSDGSTGFAHLRPDFEKFFPTTMRITMIQVSAGAKYDPSMVPNLPPGPAGDGGTVSDGGVSADVAADTGGGSGGSGGTATTGSGGSSGSGGAAGAGDGSGGTGGTTPGNGGAGGAPGSGTGGMRPGASGDVTASGCSTAPGGPGVLGLLLLTLLGLPMLVSRARRRPTQCSRCGNRDSSRDTSSA